MAERDEALAFLAWLRANNFTSSACANTSSAAMATAPASNGPTAPGSAFLSDPDILVLRLGKDAVSTTPEILAFLQGPDFLIVTKANAKSLVHRRAYLDYIGIKRFGPDGKVIGELRIVGLFTSSAYTKPASEIPLLRLKVRKVNDHFGFDPEKPFRQDPAQHPRFLSARRPVPDRCPLLTRFCEQITNWPNGRGSCPAAHRPLRSFRLRSGYVPKDVYDSDVRERTGAICVPLRRPYLGLLSAFPEGGVARVHFIIGRRGGKTPRVPQTRLEARV